MAPSIADQFIQFLRRVRASNEYFGRKELKSLFSDFQKEKGHRNSDFRRVLYQVKREKLMYEVGDYCVYSKSMADFYSNTNIASEMKEKFEEWAKIAEKDLNFCGVCGINCSSEKCLEEHLRGMRHRLHALHKNLFLQREQLVSCPEKMEAISDPPVNMDNGFMEKQCKPGEEVFMSFTMNNKDHKEAAVLVHHLLLWDTGVFQMVGNKKKTNPRKIPKNLHITFGQPKTVYVRCKAPEDFGYHFVPVVFIFNMKENQQRFRHDASKDFYIIRTVAVQVTGDLHEVLAPTEPYTVQERIPFPENVTTIQGEPLEEEVLNKLPRKKLESCNPPAKLVSQVRQMMDDNGRIINPVLRAVLDQKITVGTYIDKMHTLLWVEELQMRFDITNYDMKEVKMDVKGRFMSLKVPGLAERRPSVLKGDRVYIAECGDMSVRYEGIVHKVELETVQLGVNKRLRDKWIQGVLYNIRFSFSPTNLRLQHRAIKNMDKTRTILFPSNSATVVYERDAGIQLKPFYDKDLNDEQKTAVENIIKKSNMPAPYLIFGPPGTGKTVTLTEAIKQIYHGQPNSRLLVCCPENTASDFLMMKLINESQPGAVNRKDIYRMYAFSRYIEMVPDRIKISKSFNYDPIKDTFFYPSKKDLMSYRILVVTLMTSGRLVSADFEQNFFTHIFIDEGGHAVEPECIIPITGLIDLGKPNCSQLVIAGDPKQLGPIIRSPIAQNYGLDVSLMQRLMEGQSLYERADDGHYNSTHITKLVHNYRSHEALLVVPRTLFYDGELIQAGDKLLLESMLDWDQLPNPKFPILFHSVFGKDEREENSPSFFNRDEVTQIEKYLKNLLLEKRRCGIALKPRDIGIISPYRKQVQKIREMICKTHLDGKKEIMVGSVEEFQGQEFKVIMISTVRSCTSFIESDLKYKIGFLKNPKRFNVALTRARALMIVVGNPVVLEEDENWKFFLDYCENNGGFRGQKGNLPPDHHLPGDGDQLTHHHSPGSEGLSFRETSEEPEWQRRD